jgi:heparanase 1
LLQAGVTFLLINLSKDTEFLIKNINNHTINGESLREEYHLSPKDGNLQSQTSLLNGNPLNVTNGELPRLDPVFREGHAPIHVAPLSIAFIVIPNFEAPACAKHIITWAIKGLSDKILFEYI